MALTLLRERARALRTKGRSISDISAMTGAPKSTVSFWCRDIPLSTAQIARLAAKSRERGRVGMLKAAERKRAARVQATEAAGRAGRHDVGRIFRRDLFMIGLALYWGEGYKNGNEECALTNSDPAIIRTFIAWLNAHYGIPRSDLILRVSINKRHAHRAALVERYWSETAGIPLSQFTKTSFIKARMRRRYENVDNHFGTLRVKVRRATALRRRILGSIAALTRAIPY